VAAPGRPRLVVLAVVVAVVVGLVVAWYAGLFRDDSPESRLRETTEDIRERVRSLTH
jgi:ABC-type transporter Mla subunit MlaD